MKKLPLGIQSFRKIIEGGYVYADKTQYVYNLLDDASYYFLSRPRRFGKSLLLDTIAEAFSGDRELFKGLYIYDTDYNFEKHPVLRIDMSNIVTSSPEALESSLSTEIKKRAGNEAVGILGQYASDMFKTLIEALFKKYDKRVVVLIDEYDKPILDNLDKLETAEDNRKVLRGFYGILKSMDPYLRLTFMTGVTKFAKTSVFSELNNLYDISLAEDYANICGVATGELDIYFGEHIKALTSRRGFARIESIHDEILAWYDGYSWDGMTRVINPFSLLSFFQRKSFSSFWYASGTPKFLVDFISRDPGIFAKLKGLRVSELMLDSLMINNIEPELLLFQSGYLTVKEVIETRGPPDYLMEMPNYEVRDAFSLHVAEALTGQRQTVVRDVKTAIADALHGNDLQKLLEVLKALFASIPYQLHVNREAYYHSIFIAIMGAMGFSVSAEVQTARGRIDAVIEIGEHVYVMEFKYKDCPQDTPPEDMEAIIDEALTEGMRQIKEKAYYAKYGGMGKHIHLVALALGGRDVLEAKVEHL